MKIILKNNICACLLVMLVGAFLVPPVLFAEVDNNDMVIPPEGILPLGSLAAEDPALFDVVSELVNAIVDTDNAGLVKVAPGELLPISVKLSNFGGGRRVDVLLTYAIFSEGDEKIYETNETIAVETTASFIKTIQIPFKAVPGIYTAKTFITYQGQVVPATSQFSFTVERKIMGLFQSTFIVYGSTILILGALLSVLAYALIKRSRKAGFNPIDYSNIPRSKRIFYEILSDTITQMRLRVGDKAITIATHIDGLKINRETGRVLDITGPPAKIIATLVAEYERLLGKQVSFSLRESEKKENSKNKKL